MRDPQKHHTPVCQRLYVLVADDNAAHRDLARMQVERLGHTAELVDDGDDAVNRATASGFDVVLMDVHMPKLDGVAAARAICARLGARRPWIVAVTASLTPQERETCRDAGMDDFLSKPLTRIKLAATLARAGAANGEDPPPAQPDAASLAEDIAAARALLTSMASGADAPAFAECRQLLLDSLQRTFERMQAAIADDDRDQVRYEAHSLRGIALSAGLSGLGRLATSVEQIARVGEGPEVRLAGDSFAGLFVRVCAELRALTGA